MYQKIWSSITYISNGAGAINIENNRLQKELAYVPDNPDLYENMKAIHFINFICDMYDIDLVTRKKNIDKYEREDCDF